MRLPSGLLSTLLLQCLQEDKVQALLTFKQTQDSAWLIIAHQLSEKQDTGVVDKL